jgi:hypothetical protein
MLFNTECNMNFHTSLFRERFSRRSSLARFRHRTEDNHRRRNWPPQSSADTLKLFFIVGKQQCADRLPYTTKVSFLVPNRRNCRMCRKPTGQGPQHLVSF